MSSEQITQETVPVEKTETSTENTKPVEATIAPSTETQPAAKTWKEAISEEFRNDPNIEKFTEIDALAKSYINATQMIGKDKVAVPNKNSTDDQWNEVYDKLGRPESADKYSLNAKSEMSCWLISFSELLPSTETASFSAKASCINSSSVLSASAKCLGSVILLEPNLMSDSCTNIATNIP